ncbi:hypothetical protein AN1V17_12180 [Vallitalea sediminicola]
MKSYKEIAQMLEKYIDRLMVNVSEALSKDVAYTMEIWNTSIIRSDKEESNFSNNEKLNLYTKMLKYAETLLQPSLDIPNKYGAYRGLYVFHIYTTMKENLEELQSSIKEAEKEQHKLDDDIKSSVDFIVFTLIQDEYTDQEVKTILSKVKEIMADPSKQPKFIKCKKCGYRFCQDEDNYCTSCGNKM